MSALSQRNLPNGRKTSKRAPKPTGSEHTAQVAPPWLEDWLLGTVDEPKPSLPRNCRICDKPLSANKLDRGADVCWDCTSPKPVTLPAATVAVVAAPNMTTKGVRFCCGCKKHVDASEMKSMRDPQIPTGFVDRCENCRAANKAAIASNTSNKVLVQSPESPHVYYWRHAPPVMISDAERRARVAAQKARQRVDRSNPSRIDQCDSCDQPATEHPYLCNLCWDYNEAMRRFYFGWQEWEQKNVAHLVSYRSLPAPKLTEKPKAEEWVEVVEKILPLQLWQSTDYIPGYSPKFEYCCDYDVPLPPVFIDSNKDSRFTKMLRQRQALKAA